MSNSTNNRSAVTERRRSGSNSDARVPNYNNFSRFPLHPPSPMRIVVPGDEMAPQVNPRLRQFIQESPPRIRGQWNMQLASEEGESSRLTREEQKRALKKLMKQVYNPHPKNTSSFGKLEEEQDDDEKSCAICLEDFVPKQEVLVTLCNHMFHKTCIVRWVKSNGQCPVCRIVIGEQRLHCLSTTTTTIWLLMI
ncbi:hypothetical protein AQUCO_02100145v1 [Aquilegia coerulea]|uniref:RING-type domain-containing protein n=1 Tax=Aquilegia coerulea TaxID=218851 RepID=A0A2G5DEZ1_AQUCA|nr:hypothetical protein AQUCO_02100145v1 [Aquilegia coerulea]